MNCSAQNNDNKAAAPSDNASVSQFFVAEWNGQSSEKGYEIVKSDATLTTKINQMKSGNSLQPLKKLKEASDSERQGLIIPTGEVVVIYRFGMRRSGRFKPAGIESLKLVGKTLEVTLKQSSQNNSDPRQPQIQVISYPWMAFGVPETYEFNNIEIK